MTPSTREDTVTSRSDADPALDRLDPSPGREPVRVGLLGCASIARRRTAPAILREPAAELVAVASRSAAKAAEFGTEFGAVPLHGYQALLDRPDVDAVYVPVPTGLHAEWIERALLAGKHVLCEKPLTDSPVATARLLALAAERGLVLMENLASLRNPVHRRIAELVDEGAIGELRALEAAFAFPPLDPHDVRYDPELGGGALLDAGVYPVTTARTLLGNDVAVVGSTLTRRGAGGVDVAGTALLADARGRTAVLTFGFEHSYRCEYRLWGSEGQVTLDRAYSPPPTWESVIRISGQGEVREETLPPWDQFRTSVQEFVAAVARGVPSPTYPGSDVLAQARLLEEIRTSARVTERPLGFRHDDEEVA
jgi:dTDP-3,4-didehydro-2,6-dideoxy-alpha-D-glucose 3-reductase